MVCSLSSFVCLLETSLCFSCFLVSLGKDLNMIKSLFLQVLPHNWNRVITVIYCIWLNFSVGWKHCRSLFFYLQGRVARCWSRCFDQIQTRCCRYHFTVHNIHCRNHSGCAKLPLHESIKYSCIHKMFSAKQLKVDKARFLNPPSL